MDRMSPREQGDVGELSAMMWLAEQGAKVCIPLGHSPDYDLVAGDGRRWYIPADRVEGTTGILLGGPKYARFEIESGRAIPGVEEGGRYTSASSRRDTEAVKRVRL